MKKFHSLLLLSLSSSFIHANNTVSNPTINFSIKTPTKLKEILNILYPDYNIISYSQDSSNLLNKKLKDINFHNIKPKFILKSLEYQINSYITIDKRNKIIKLEKYKVFRYHIPVNSSISSSTKVVLGTGGGTPSPVTVNDIYGGGGTKKESGYSKSFGNSSSMGLKAKKLGKPVVAGSIPPEIQKQLMSSNGGFNPNKSFNSGTTESSGSQSDTGGSTIVIKDTGLSGLIKIIRSLLTPDEKIYFDIKTGLLQLMITPDTELQVNKLLSPILKIRREQIKVTMKVLEFTKEKTNANGISWNKFWNNVINGISISAAMNMLKVNNNIGTISSTTIDQQHYPLGLTLKGNSNVKGFIGLLNQFGNVKIISEPSVILRNGETVIINNGQEISYIKSTTVTSTDTGTNITYNPGKLLNGFRLVLNANIERLPGKTPKIILFLAPILQTTTDIKEVGSTNTGIIELPTIDTRSISLYTTIKNNDTVIIGGFKKIYQTSNTNGVPLLDKLPILGNLFSYKESSKKENRILFIVSTKIVQDN